MRKILRYLAAKLRFRSGCDAPFKDTNAMEQDHGDSDLAIAVIERLQDTYNSLSYGISAHCIPPDKPFCSLIFDRPLTRKEIGFISTYHFEARSIPYQYLNEGKGAAYYFHSLHSLYLKRKL